MIPAFGKLVRQRRQQLGLRVVDVVRLLGVYKPGNEAKPIRAVEELERTGKCRAEFFQKICRVLTLDAKKLAETAEKHEVERQQHLDAPVPMTVIWAYQREPSRYGWNEESKLLPLGTSRAEAIARATSIAKELGHSVRLLISRRHLLVIDQTGVTIRAERLDLPTGKCATLLLDGRIFVFQDG